MISRVLPALLAALLAGSGVASANPLRVETRYECDWWSPQQMRGLNPNDPPPKTTRVRLDRWEYSDPVGVPHPDTVLLVAAVPKDVSGRIVVRTTWIGRKPLRSRVVVNAPAGSLARAADGVSVEVPIAVQPTINSLRPRLLRSRVLLDGRDIGGRDLPIVLGD